MPLQYIQNGCGHMYKNISVEDINTSMILVMTDMYLYKVVKRNRIIVDPDDGRMLGDSTNDILVCRCNENGDIVDPEVSIARFA